MKRAALRAILAACAGCLIFGQSTDTRPKFVAADVHAAAPASGSMRTIPVHDGRYEVKNASMLDMVRVAYSFDADKILGGPSWLEMDRFDITAKLPGETSPDDQKLMLETLLEDRFKLVVRKETKPMPGYALTAGKKPSLKEAAGNRSERMHPAGFLRPGAGGRSAADDWERQCLGPDADYHHCSRPRRGDSIQLPQHRHGGIRIGAAQYAGGQHRHKPGGR